MPEIITRRSFLRVLTGILAAPAVLQVSSLMPLRGDVFDFNVDALMVDAYESYSRSWVFPWDDPRWKPLPDYYETLVDWGEITRAEAKEYSAYG